MSFRYTDLDPVSSGVRDFVARKRVPTIAHIFFIFLTALVVSVCATLLADNKTTLMITLFLILGMMGWYVILQTQRNRDLLLATEFQNSLFASALGINNKFCIIMKRDGNIVYIDRSFQEMFPDFLRQSRRTIDVFLEQGKVSMMDSEKIYSALERGIYEKVVFEIRGSNEFHRVVMSIEPIMRPSGFILLRGRDYVETRNSLIETGQAAPLNKSTITLFSYVMDTMKMGVYMAGPSGTLIYANPVLEHWLGFADGEIVSSNLSLQDIFQYPGDRAKKIEPDDFEGEIMLQKKAGGLMRSFINQKIIRDENNKMIGCTAVVHNFAEPTESFKKEIAKP